MTQIEPLHHNDTTIQTTSTSWFYSQQFHTTNIFGTDRHGRKEALAMQRARAEFIQFCTEKIMRKECVKFVPNIKSLKVVENAKDEKKRPEIYRCMCGELPQNHKKNTIGLPQYFEQGIKVVSNDLTSGKSGDVWTAEDAIKEFHTNAFGKIDFVLEDVGGRKPAKFMRLADNTDVDVIINDLFIKHWHMTQPHYPSLVITVVGGAKNFQLDGKKKEIFNHGLVNAAKTTHAWLITSGFNMGVMKAVGEAVAEGQSYDWNKDGLTHTLRCIGIAPWGYIEGRERLASRDDRGCWNAAYKVNNVILHEQPVSLNPDHTHFLFVDDGKRNVYNDAAGKFRARLEQKISLPKTEGGLGICVVLVVVEGGTDAINDTQASLAKRIPVVLCKGTGRAADILAYAFSHFITTADNKRVIKDEYKRTLAEMLKRAYGKTWADKGKNENEETQNYMDKVLKCCEDEKLITVFDMNKLNEDLDVNILSALLKGQGASEAWQLKEQLMLALTWNRSDIAEEKIFTKSIIWDNGQLDDIMTCALKENKVNFVRLLLQNGVVMKEYLTVARLRELYDVSPIGSHLRYLLKNAQITLRDIDHLLKKLLGKHGDPTYQRDSLMIMKGTEATIDEEKFANPFRELLKWAVLLNRQDMARFIWERGDEAVMSALAASRLYGALADTLDHYESALQEQYSSNKVVFEQLAVKLIDECHNISRDKAKCLIERRYVSWGDIDCLEMAASAQNKEFLSTSGAQNSVNERWKNHITSSWPKLILCLILPFIIPCALHTQHPLSGCKKIQVFYAAPMIKFACNTFMEMAFLILFSYMILFGYSSTTISHFEKTIMIWVSIDAVEEFRQIFFTSSGSLRERIASWWNFSLFNRIDALVLILFLVAFLLRIDEKQFIIAKMIYSAVCILLFIRLLRDYSASSYLGPKLVMIKRMLQDLMLYVLILAVVLCAYGIAVHSIMYPEQEFYSLIFRDIFYYPYFMLYGQLFIDEMTGQNDECLANSTAIMSNGSTCPQFNWLTLVYTAAYLIIANTLLINVLIAIFNHVFEEIETNSIQIWKYGMYFLVVEYEQKPVLAPPFIIFEHIGRLFHFMCTRSCCKKPAEELGVSEQDTSMLQIFEKECCKQLLQKKRISDKENLQSKLQYICAKVDEMAKQSEDKLFSHHSNAHTQHCRTENNNEGKSAARQASLKQRTDNANDDYLKGEEKLKNAEDKSNLSSNRLEEKGHGDKAPLKVAFSEPENTKNKQPEFQRRALRRESQATENEYSKAVPFDDSSDSDDNSDSVSDDEHADLSRRTSTTAHQSKGRRSLVPIIEDEKVPEDQLSEDNNVPSSKGRSNRKTIQPDLSKKTKQTIKTQEFANERIVQSEQTSPLPALEGQGREVVSSNAEIRQAVSSVVAPYIEERMARLEERTTATLDNIETLLRSVVFSRGTHIGSRDQSARRNYDRFF